MKSLILLLISTSAMAQIHTPLATVLDRSPGALPKSYTYTVPESNSITDFMIQDICVDSTDRGVPLDPAMCEEYGLNRRNLKMGEDLPYSKYSRAFRNNAFIPATIQNSYPIWSGQHFNYIRTMDGAGTTRTARNWEIGDGYDILESNGAFTSIIGTRDPVTTSTGYVWWGQNCQKEDGWGLFPNDILERLEIGKTESLVFNLIGGESCDPLASLNEAFTYYARTNVRYTSNRVLESLKTYHFSGAQPETAGAIEVFFHTRFYGFTRWEAWKTVNECIRLAASRGVADPAFYCSKDEIQRRADADGACNGPIERYLFGQYFYRTLCVDNSFIDAHARPLNAFSIPLSTTFALSRNLVNNADFVSPLDGTYTVMSPADGNFIIKKETGTKNPYLEMSGSFNGNQGIRQTLAPNTWNESVAVIQSGALIKGPEDGSIKIQIDLYDSDKVFIQSYYVIYRTSGDFTPARFYYAWNVSSRGQIGKMVIRVLPMTAGTYQVDELFTAILPRRAN